MNSDIQRSILPILDPSRRASTIAQFKPVPIPIAETDGRVRLGLPVRRGT